MIVFRDDDTGYQSDMYKLKKVHEIHQRNNIPHRMAVICRDLHKAKELIEFINNDPLCEPEFHCYDHIRHTDNIDIMRDQFTEGVKEFENAFGKKPSIWYPTWNLTNAHTMDIAKEFGMVTSWQKVSLGYYIEKKGDVMFDTINYHFWYDPERHELEPAMMVYKSLK